MRTDQSMFPSLDAEMCIQFEWGHVEVDYKGNMVPFDFPYRDPITWMRSLLQDETLSESIMWHSVRKTYHENGNEIRIIDEPNTADGWWDIDVRIPVIGTLQHVSIVSITLIGIRIVVTAGRIAGA